MNDGWITAAVGDCIDKSFRPTGRPIPKTAYKERGKYPIVDQGSDPVAGWTDDESTLVTEGLPIILFGDHTRALKFLEGPFARGADGTQILRAAAGVDSQFLHYACRALELPSRGYNRHFTLLRESEIQRPNHIVEQRYIGRVLRAVEDAIEHQQTVSSTWRALKASVMERLFKSPSDVAGDGMEGWSTDPLGEHFSVHTGTTPSRRNLAFWDGGIVPWVKTAEVNYQTIVGTEEHITDYAIDSGAATVHPAGTILVAMYGQGVTRGRVARLGIDAACNQACAALNQKTDAVLPGYLYYFLEWQYNELRGRAHGGNQQNLNLDIVRAFPVAHPGRENQQGAIDLLDALTARIDLAERRVQLTHDVFNHLLHGMTSGEVGVSDLDLSALTDIQLSLEETAA